LGALGWLVNSQLDGNFGIKDQRLSLQWVQANIANFGGNPNQITIFGESAGAGSVGVHLMSSKSKGLYNQAIMESNPFGLPFMDISQATAVGNKFASLVGCDDDDLVCLRNISVDDVVNQQNNVFVIPDPFRQNLLDIALTWAPVIDNDEVLYQPIDAFAEGEFNTNIPVILGTNSAEGVMFVYGLLGGLIGNNPISWIEYDLLLTAIYQEDVITVKDAYPCDESDCRMTLSILLTHYLFTCPSRNVGFSIGNYSSSAGIYFYNFNHSLSFNAWGPNFTFCQDYACHGAELPFVFHSAEAAGYTFTSAEEVLSEAMVNYWANFAHTGNPSNGNTVPVQWKQLQRSSLFDMEFATPTIPQQYLDKDFCDMWDSLGYNF